MSFSLFIFLALSRRIHIAEKVGFYQDSARAIGFCSDGGDFNASEIHRVLTLMFFCAENKFNRDLSRICEKSHVVWSWFIQ